MIFPQRQIHGAFKGGRGKCGDVIKAECLKYNTAWLVTQFIVGENQDLCAA